MKKLILLAFLAIIVFSCSDNSTDDNNNSGLTISINVTSTKMQINEGRKFMATVSDTAYTKDILWKVEPSNILLTPYPGKPQFIDLTAPATPQTITLTAYLSNNTDIKASATIVVEELRNQGKLLFTNWNIAAVDSDPATEPTSPTKFTLDSTYTITYFDTYHYFNNGVIPGKVSFKHSDGTIYGPFQTTGGVGQGNVVNAVWLCYPYVEFKAGEYTIIDSDPKTWSFNSGSEGKGFSAIWGIAKK
jgi:hypothetical protein